MKPPIDITKNDLMKMAVDGFPLSLPREEDREFFAVQMENFFIKSENDYWATIVNTSSEFIEVEICDGLERLLLAHVYSSRVIFRTPDQGEYVSTNVFKRMGKALVGAAIFLRLWSEEFTNGVVSIKTNKIGKLKKTFLDKNNKPKYSYAQV